MKLGSLLNSWLGPACGLLTRDTEMKTLEFEWYLAFLDDFMKELAGFDVWQLERGGSFLEQRICKERELRLVFCSWGSVAQRQSMLGFAGSSPHCGRNVEGRPGAHSVGKTRSCWLLFSHQIQCGQHCPAISKELSHKLFHLTVSRTF